MKDIVVSILLITWITITYSQECHQEMRPVTVCGDSSSTSQLGGKGEKGSKGEVGGAESCAPGSFESEVKEKLSEMQNLLTSASCLTSCVYGRQTLRSGEKAFCDGGWTVFQRRLDGEVNFQLGWDRYKSGFGNLSGEFWFGLDKIHQLTHRRGCKLRVDLWDFSDNHAFAEYSSFSVEGESDLYRLHVDGYSGTAGDSLITNTAHNHNNQPFSKPDRDNDNYANRNCATFYGMGSGGWWFNACLRSPLNAVWGVSGGQAHNIF